MDTTSAFFHAPLPERLSLNAEIPEGHPEFDKTDTHLLKINKKLYGLRETSRVWWDLLCKVLLQRLKLRQLIYEECLSYSHQLLLLAHVDDILVFGSTSLLKQTHYVLAKQFKLTVTKINARINFLG